MTKYLLLLVVAMAAVSASAQTPLGMSVLSNAQPQMLTMPEHSQHASQTPMAQEQSLLETSMPVFGQGERPLWEVMPPAEFVCLGDAARSFKEEHASTRKASVVWSNF